VITRTTTTTTRLGVLLAVAAFALTGCATSSDSAAESTTASDAVTISDAWAKAADSGMSAAFGELANDSGDDVTVVSATTEASSTVELHETVEDGSGQMTMRKIDGGFVIPAGGSLSLEPGGNHLMLMGLTSPLMAGDDITITLTFSDDSTFAFTAPVKDYSGANENYEGGDSGMEMDQ